MVISIRRALLTHGGWPFGETVRKETSVKNKRDRLFFTQLFVPQASQSSYDRRAELEVLLAIPSAQSACGMEVKMANLTIEKVIGREIIDSRGNPTVEAEVCLSGRNRRKRHGTQWSFYRRVRSAGAA